MAPHSSTLACKIPWTEEPGGLQSMGSQRVGHDFTFTFTFHFHALGKEMAIHSSVLAWRITGMVELGGLPSIGSYRVGHDWSDLAAAAAAAQYILLNEWVNKQIFVVHASLFELLSFFCVTYHWPVLLVITSFAFWVPVAISFHHLACNGIKSLPHLPM